jgi:hypothetical protein
MEDRERSEPIGPEGAQPGADLDAGPGTGRSSAFDLPPDDLLDLLEQAELDVEGRMPYSSNATFLALARDPDHPERRHRVIYKPGRGERPLWDFPPDLYRREVATFRLARSLGWSVVPPTTIGTGPLGEGSIQAFVNADLSHHYFTLLEDGVALDDLHRLCVLDLIANNTDRKSGHCLLGRDGRIYGIDHGLAFHAQFKLRTVMWDFVGEPIPDHLLVDVSRFLDEGPPAGLTRLLDRFEIDAMIQRAAAVVDEGVFPDDDTGGHRYPWPLV